MWPFNRRYVASQEEQVVVQNRDGRIEWINGPAQIFSNRWKHESVRVQPLPLFVASCEQVLEILHHDGRLERRVGPASQILDEAQHKSIKVVTLKRHVTSPDQLATITYRDGRKEWMRGPCEVVFDPTLHARIDVNALQRRLAHQGQYLKVQYLDGRNEHVPGPTELCINPAEHSSIECCDGLKLEANEALVVYTRKDNDGDAAEVDSPTKLGSMAFAVEDLQKAHVVPKGGGSGAVVVSATAAAEAADQGACHVDRRVVRGPAVFMPEPNEWLHTFSWHGSIKDGRGSKTGSPGDTKVPHALNFSKLRCMPDQIYVTVRDVRTSDDARVTVHLMIFYELRAIEMMLDSTNDLIGDILSATAADVMTFAASVTYEAFLQRTAELSKAHSTFPILASRMAQTGTELLKVVYRGYTTSPQLQEMHNQAITRRTKLRLESDAAREEQATKTMELQCERERSEQQQALEEKRARHELAMRALVREQERAQRAEEQSDALRAAEEKASSELVQQRKRHDEEVRQMRELASVELERLQSTNVEELKKQQALKNLDVDLTKYLCALASLKPDQHLRIDGGGTPYVHVEAKM